MDKRERIEAINRATIEVYRLMRDLEEHHDHALAKRAETIFKKLLDLDYYVNTK